MKTDNPIQVQLEQLGFQEYEARIYSVLLAHSPANATYIAKQCGLARSSVYTTLSSLIAKGFVGTTFYNGVKQFMAKEHTGIKEMLLREQRAVISKLALYEELEKKINDQASTLRETPKYIFFEGQEGLKKIYMTMMRNAGQGAVMRILRDEFVWQDEWNFVFEQEWNQRVAKIKREKNIQTKLFVNTSGTERKKQDIYNAKAHTIAFFLPKNSTIENFAIYTIGDSVSLMSTEAQNLVGIYIINKNFADNINTILDALKRK